MAAMLDPIEGLDDFQPEERRKTLEKLLRSHPTPPETKPLVNMHFHSFFSYNSHGWSPSHILWGARTHGFFAAGLCDFDVLDGLEEFYQGGTLAGVRTAVFLETRCFVPEWAAHEISSPGEPGVMYMMGAGFGWAPAPGSPKARTLEDLAQRARNRNQSLISRIGSALPALDLDYGREVLPRTPKGVATERHIVSALVDKAREQFPKPGDLAAFWSPVLALSTEKTAQLLQDRPSFEEKVRSRLVKKGGAGYEQPTPSTFPTQESFIQWVLECQAIPMATWLDGTSSGEADPEAFLDLMTAKGCAAANIIPDRNWNLKDPSEAKKKRELLDRFVRAAIRRDLPLNIGTEMNKLGLPFVDDLEGPALSPYREAFLDGAKIMVGQGILLRYAHYSYLGPQSASDFPNGRKKKNAFFSAIGTLPPLSEGIAKRLEDMGPEKALIRIRAACLQGRWI